MSLWISVYCQERIDRLTPARLKDLIQREMPDWSNYYAALTVTAVKPSLFHLNYKIREASLYDGCPAASRARVQGGVPIVMDQVSNPDEVAGWAGEQLEEYLKGRRDDGANLVREHLACTREIFAFCMKQCHYDDAYGRSLAFAAAQGLAKEGKGLFREDEFGWLQATRSGNKLLLRV